MKARRYRASVALGDDETREHERPVRSLQDLFNACRDARPLHPLHLTVSGPDGEVTLKFASFIRKARP
jgi:hypothetical protein